MRGSTKHLVLGLPARAAEFYGIHMFCFHVGKKKCGLISFFRCGRALLAIAWLFPLLLHRYQILLFILFYLVQMVMPA